MQQTTQRGTRGPALRGLELLPPTQVARLKVLLPKRSQESLVLAGLLIIGLIPWWVFFFFFFAKSFKSCNCTRFQSCFLHSLFSPSRAISRDLKKMKETTVTKLECMKTTPPPPSGQGTDLMTLVFIPHPYPPATCSPYTLGATPSQLCPCSLAQRKMVPSPGAKMRGRRKCCCWGHSKIV